MNAVTAGGRATGRPNVLEVRARNAVIGGLLILIAGVKLSPSGGDGQLLPDARHQVASCVSDGWTDLRVSAAGLQRNVLVKAPPVWTRGAIVALHGGSGAYFNYCFRSALADNGPMLEFAERSVASGFAFLSLDSTLDQVTDDAGRHCGKVWDDNRASTTSVDLPFVKHVIEALVPSRRPAGSATALFLVGHSSGGYMTQRAATFMNSRVTAFAMVASGDTFGWNRSCDRRLGSHGFAPYKVYGKGIDNDTGREVQTRGACAGSQFAREELWEIVGGPARPPAMALHAADDGVHDITCNDRLADRLRTHGFRVERFVIPSSGDRQDKWHAWQARYNNPLIRFLTRHGGG